MFRYAPLVLLAGCFDFGIGPIDITGGLNFPDWPAPGTPGSLGKIQFGYTEGCAGGELAFNFPCPMDGAAIAEGGTTVVHLAAVTGVLPVSFNAISSSPGVFDIVDVIQLDASTAELHVRGLSPGASTLTIFDGDVSYDAISLSVARPAVLAFTDPAPVLLVNQRESLAVVAHDQFGTLLYGRGELALETGALELRGDDPFADAIFVGTDHAIVSGATLGAFPVTAHLGALTATASVSIVDLSAVSQIIGTQAFDGSIAFESETSTGAQVRGAHCTPSVTAPFTASETLEGAAPNQDHPGDHVFLEGTYTGPSTVSCAIGAIVGSISFAGE
jgi:hypothetical protein